MKDRSKAKKRVALRSRDIHVGWIVGVGVLTVIFLLATFATAYRHDAYSSSCGVKRRALLFNLELARVPKECIEYVVVHELTHLKVQNHNKSFEALMTQRLPGWRNLRQRLNEFIALPL